MFFLKCCISTNCDVEIIKLIKFHNGRFYSLKLLYPVYLQQYINSQADAQMLVCPLTCGSEQPCTAEMHRRAHSWP